MSESSFLDQIASELESYRSERLSTGKVSKCYPADLRAKVVVCCERAVCELGMTPLAFAKHVGLSSTAIKQWRELASVSARERRRGSRLGLRPNCEDRMLPVRLLGEGTLGDKKKSSPAAAVIVVWDVSLLGQLLRELSGAVS